MTTSPPEQEMGRSLSTLTLQGYLTHKKKVQRVPSECAIEKGPALLFAPRSSRRFPNMAQA